MPQLPEVLRADHSMEVPFIRHHAVLIPIAAAFQQLTAQFIKDWVTSHLKEL